MSSGAIDERVVSMKFDNNNFERNTATSLGTIDKLNKALKFEGAAKGLADISDKANGVNLSGMEKAVDSISSKFSAFGAIAFSVIQNLTNQALSFGESALNSILDPLIKGGQERALTIEQAKFQFEGLGMNVNDTMASARAAVLGTAYSLADAAKAASMFGASGMRAGDKMTSSLRGIAGVAAMTSSSYEDISNIFTTVAGNGRLMGDQLVQLSSRGINVAATIAKSMGISEQAVRDLVSAKGGSQISFQMFSDAMDKAFGQHATDANKTYAGSLANMHAALARIGADVASPKYEQQRLIFNAMTPVIDKLHAALMPLIDDFSAAGNESANGLVKMINGLNPMIVTLTEHMPYIVKAIDNIKASAMALIKPIQEAFNFTFPPKSMNILGELLYKFEVFASKLQITEDTAFDLKRTFLGVFAVFDIAKMIIVGIVRVFEDLHKSSTKSSTGILDITANMGDFLQHLDQVLRAGQGINRFMTGLESTLQVPMAVLRAFGTMVAWAFGKLSGSGTMDLGDLGSKLTSIFAPLIKIGSVFANIGSAFAKVWHAVIMVFGGIWAVIGPLITEIINGTARIVKDFTTAVAKMNPGDALKAFNIAAIGAGIVYLYNFFTRFRGLLSGQTKFTFISQFKAEMLTLSNSLKVFQAQVKAGALLTIAIAIGILAASLWLLSSIKPDKMAAGLVGLASVFNLITVSLKSVSMMAGSMKDGTVAKMLALATVMVVIAIAVDILANAVTKMSRLSWPDLIKGLLGVLVLLAGIAGAVKLMGNPEKLVATGTGLVIIAIAIDILVGAVKKLGTLDPNQLISGLTGIGVILGELVGFMKLIKEDSMAISSATALLVMAVAVQILAGAVAKFATLSQGDLTKGIMAMAFALATIAGFTQITGDASIISAVSLVIISVALLILAKALNEFGAMAWDSIGKAVTLLFASLIIIAAGMTLMMGALPGAASLVVASAALIILGYALSQLGAMSWDAIGKAMTLLFGSLFMLALGLEAMMLALPGAGALLVASVALIALAVALDIMGKMSWAGISKAMTTLLSVFILMTVFLTLMIVALPGAAALLVASAALAVLAVVLEAFGAMSWESILKALMMLSGVFIVLGLAGYALEPVLPAIFALAGALALIGLAIVFAGVGMLAFSLGFAALAGSMALGVPAMVNGITQLAMLIPVVMKQLAIGVLLFGAVIAGAGVQMTATFTTVLLSIVNAINNVAPSIVATLVKLIVLLLEAINLIAPIFTQTVITLLMGFLTAVNIVGPALINTGVILFMALINAIVALVPFMADAGMQMINGVLNAIANNTTSMVTAGTNIIIAFLNGISQNIPRVVQAGVDLVLSLVNSLADGIRNNQQRMSDAGGNLVGAIVDGMTGGLSDKVFNLIKSATHMGDIVIVALKAALGIKSPSKKAYAVGVFTVDGLVNSFDDNASRIGDSASNLGNAALTALSESMSKASDYVDMNVDPTIRPVIDFSAVKAGVGTINGLLASGNSINVAGSYATAASVSFGVQGSQSISSPDVTGQNGNTTTLKFEQNNYSPKALSDIEIYRQTQRQLATIKGALATP